MSGVAEEPRSSDLPAILRRESSDDHQPGPRKKSRKSTIMEALRRGASQTDETLAPSRQMSTVAYAPNPKYTYFRYQARPKSPTAVSKKNVSPTGLPFYNHTESLDSSSLPALPTSQVQYLRDRDQANYAVTQLISRMEPIPGSRWRGVIGFDMEWTVKFGAIPRKTGLIQLSDDTTILLIQISSMESFPHRLKDLITSANILKVGVNIGGDMKKLCRDFGPSYAARGVLDLSHLARVVDVGLVGTAYEDLDSGRASSGVGIPKNPDSTQINNALDTNLEGELSDEDNARASAENGSAMTTIKEGANELVRPGRRLMSLARLVRRYLARDLDKGEVRTSNWENKLSNEQKQYAANDAHAGLALYYALRKVHSLSVAKGVIPVPSPPPWANDPSLGNTTAVPSSGPRPAPPPFRARTTNYKATPAQKFVPVSELQNLTPNQLESLLPWDLLIKDLQAEFDEARAAVLVKRKKEGVDLKGRGEAVVAAAEAPTEVPTEVVAEVIAEVVVEAAVETTPEMADEMADEVATGVATEVAPVIKPVVTPSLSHISNPNSITAIKHTAPNYNPFGNTYYDSPQTGNIWKEIAYESRRRQPQQSKLNEGLGSKWPPTRIFPSRSTNNLPNPPLPATTPVVSQPATETEPPPDNDEVEPQPQKPTPPPISTKRANSPAPSSGARSAPHHLRAYLLWHKQQLPLSQICASLRSPGNPLAKSTVISYIIQALQADGELPFEQTRLKDLISIDGISWVRENYKQFLESKVGPIADNGPR